MDSSLEEKLKNQHKDTALVAEQLERFKNGFPYLEIDRPATVEDGIIKLSDKALIDFISFYEQEQFEVSVCKFVPASGAASRMFKRLFEFMSEEENTAETDEFLKTFFGEIENFAFFDTLDKTLEKNGKTVQSCLDNKEYHSIVKALLLPEGMNYGSLPKGLLEFHRYGDKSRTPVAEHLAEGEAYALDKNDDVQLHFTVSPEHLKMFKDHVAQLNKGFTSFNISFSQQLTNTDTIAVNMDNTPFVEESGKILFRPAGHGALIENLDQVDADIIFVKNIDNVVPDHYKHETVRYKKALAGLLMSVQSKVFSYQEQLDRNINELELIDIENFLKNELFMSFKNDYAELEFTEKVGYLKYLLHRPIRVCGMVPNTGEPGGGPFWVNEKDGSQSLQIAETSQIDLGNDKAKAALEKATHFNPVDIVCAVKDSHGRKYDLKKYRDPETGFITEKSKNGKKLKALELPGLWNGAMSEWITLFVEVPLVTFNPVKTVNDLLRKEHQHI